MKETIAKIFIGYDPREHSAFEVCRHSILKHSSIPVDIQGLYQNSLRRIGFYRRTGNGGKDCFDGRPFSTEFTFTRFLVPHLMQYRGVALFVDCDFLFRADIKELFESFDDIYPLMCVHHDYAPKTEVKMDGAVQTAYAKKNWSSLILWNCGDKAHFNLTVDDVNTKPGSWLHGFSWLHNRTLGKIPEEWNYLEGHTKYITPKAVHFTRGGPWLREYQDVEYADEWREVLSEICG